MWVQVTDAGLKQSTPVHCCFSLCSERGGGTSGILADEAVAWG